MISKKFDFIAIQLNAVIANSSISELSLEKLLELTEKEPDTAKVLYTGGTYYYAENAIKKLVDDAERAIAGKKVDNLKLDSKALTETEFAIFKQLQGSEKVTEKTQRIGNKIIKTTEIELIPGESILVAKYNKAQIVRTDLGDTLLEITVE